MKQILYKSWLLQTVFDVALQHYGSLEGLLWLLEDNPQLLEPSGRIAQFKVNHKIRRGEFIVKPQLSYPYPASEGTIHPEEENAWINENGTTWITEDGQNWLTE